MQYTAIVAGERVEVTLNGVSGHIEATVANRTYTLDVVPVEPGTYWIHWNSVSIEVVVAESGEAYVVSVGGRRLEVEVLDARKALRRAVHQGDEGLVELRAPMPGKIVRVLREEGGEVEVGQGIVVMEAMKMQNEIKAPKKGRIAKLAVREGSAVSGGDLLATVE